MQRISVEVNPMLLLEEEEERINQNCASGNSAPFQIKKAVW
jgi:hypothetical protein